MEVAIISPIKMLEDFSTRSTWQMALAQHVLANREYTEFFRTRSVEGDYIILDNGTAEGVQLSLQDLIEAASAVVANEVVLPDAWKDGRRTIELVEEALTSGVFTPRYTIQAVAQGKTTLEWLWCFFKLLYDERIDVIGIPKNLDELFPGTRVAQWFGRAGVVNWLAEILNTIGRSKPLHLLGIWSDYRELLLYSDEAKKYIRSVDTSSPVHCGLRGIRYPSVAGAKPYAEPKEPMDFRTVMPVNKKLTFSMVHDNIDMLFEAAEATCGKPRAR